MEIKQLQEEFNKLSTDFLATLERKVGEIKAGSPDGDVTTKAALDKMNSRLDEIEILAKRAKVLSGNTYSDVTSVDPKAAERKEAWGAYLRYGKDNITPEQKAIIGTTKQQMIKDLVKAGAGPDEIKLLTEQDNTQGGFLAIPEFVQEIIKGVVLISPMRSVARVRQTSARSVRVPKRTQTATAVWVSEVGTRAETQNPAYGLEEIPNHELYAFADVSNQDLEDSAFDLNAELQMEFSEQLAKAEGLAFVSGTGVGQPEGLLTNTAIPIAVQGTGGASVLLYQGFVNAWSALKTVYAKEASWIMNRATLGAVRSILDNQNRPIWQPQMDAGLANGNPGNILGSPYVEFPDMPNVAANAFPVAYGAFRRGYWIVDRIAIEVQRDPYTQNTKGATRFIARKRVGGQVVLAESMLKLKVSVN